jgi:Ca-activated chloride channel family protein
VEPDRVSGLCRNWQDRALLIISAFLVLALILRIEAARADGGEGALWGLEFHDGAARERSLALDTAIRAEVTGLTARVIVEQRFRNDGDAWKEAVYRYPLPTGAAVDRLRVQVGSRVLEGEIGEKEEATRRYQQAAANGKVATLVDQQRPNQFETRLANIGPGEEIFVSIGFLVSVGFRDGTFSLEFPLTFTPRWDPAVPGALDDRRPLPQHRYRPPAGDAAGQPREPLPRHRHPPLAAGLPRVPRRPRHTQ